VTIKKPAWLKQSLFPDRDTRFVSLHTTQIVYGAQCLTGNLSRTGCKVNSEFYLVPNLRMRGAICLRHLYDFTAYAGKGPTLMEVLNVLQIHDTCPCLVRKFKPYITCKSRTKKHPPTIEHKSWNLMFCWPCITVYQYSETNVMHFLFSLLRIKSLYMFRALLAHLQEALHKRHLVYCVRVMSVGFIWMEVSLKAWCSQQT
jgi:hypothetical protein